MATLICFFHFFYFNESLRGDKTWKSDDDEGSFAGDDAGEHEALSAKI